MAECTFKVSVPAGNGYSEPRNMLRVVEHFQQNNLAAELVSKDGVPEKDADGRYTLITKDERAKGLAPFLLQRHYGLYVRPVQNA